MMMKKAAKLRRRQSITWLDKYDIVDLLNLCFRERLLFNFMSAFACILHIMFLSSIKILGGGLVND